MLMTKESIFAQLDSAEEFPISFSDVWEWLGYPRKDYAVRDFKELEMVEGEEFRVSPDSGETRKVGRPPNEIEMTVDTFKMWSMSVRTSKGKEVRKYYLQVEKEWKALKDSLLSAQVRQQPSRLEIATGLLLQDIVEPWGEKNPGGVELMVRWKADEYGLNLPQSGTLTPQQVQQLEPTAIVDNSEALAEMESRLAEAEERSTKKEDRLLALIDKLSLAGNRAGLAGNKAIKEAQFLAEQLKESRREQKAAISELRQDLAVVSSREREALDQIKELAISLDEAINSNQCLESEVEVLRRKLEANDLEHELEVAVAKEERVGEVAIMRNRAVRAEDEVLDLRSQLRSCELNQSSSEPSNLDLMLSIAPSQPKARSSNGSIALGLSPSR